MDKHNWKINDDNTYINSISKIYTPWLDRSFDVWVDLDNGQNWMTQHQVNALENFMSLSVLNMAGLRTKFEKVYYSELKKNTIQKIDFVDILETINWQETQICIPQHAESENRYVLFLPETKWKIVNSDCPLELEVLFTNENIEICQEMSGLWCRTEWFDHYLKRPKNNL